MFFFSGAAWFLVLCYLVLCCLVAAEPLHSSFWLPLAVVSVIGLPVALVALQRLLNPNAHPVARALQRYGEPASVADLIEAELSDSACPPHQEGNVIVTKSWLLVYKRANFFVVTLRDVVWVYEEATNRYTNSVYEGTTHATMIYYRDNRCRSLPCKDLEASVRLINAIMSRDPGILVGYQAERLLLWQQGKLARQS